MYVFIILMSFTLNQNCYEKIPLKQIKSANITFQYVAGCRLFRL